MDFDSPDLRDFRLAARDWLANNHAAFTAEHGSSGTDFAHEVTRAKAWQKRKYQAGYAGIFVPEIYGGGGKTFAEEIIFRQEQAKYAIPLDIFFLGTGLTLPVLLKYASEEVKLALIPGILSGQEIWCQLFSEPSAGSDLASARTRSWNEGEEWVIDGQKVWTTLGHIADRALVLTRSDPDAAKHKGLTCFHLDMTSPGISLRPIVQLNGDPKFNETFLDKVRVPATQMLGQEGGGWDVVISTLMFERFQVSAVPGADVDELVRLAVSTDLRGRPAIEDSFTRASIARWHAQRRGIANIQLGTLEALSRGAQPGPEVSVTKLIGSKRKQDLSMPPVEAV